MQNIKLPLSHFTIPRIDEIDKKETVIFYNQSARRVKRSQAFNLIRFGILWLFLCSLLAIVLYSTLSRFINIYIIIATVVFSLAIIIGFVISGIGVWLLIKKRKWYVGTTNKLYIIHKKKEQSFNWNNFAEDVKISNEDKKITLQLLPEAVQKTFDDPSMKKPMRLVLTNVTDPQKTGEQVESLIQKSKK